jgi:cytochrome oxidase Cu insertion factor (SCO1/SenC/PrrC family)
MWSQIKNLWPLWLMLAASIAVGLAMTPWQWAKRPAAMKYAEYLREQQRLADAGEASPRQPVFDAPTFSFVDQQNHPFSSKDLLGHVYIADFIFTQCAGTCPTLSRKMAMLQTQLASPNIQFVSFSVDPAHDTPAVLAQYARKLNANPSRWHFLSAQAGPLADLLVGFHFPADEALAHSDRFVLVDDQGRVRGTYNALDDAELTQLQRDAGRLPAAR